MASSLLVRARAGVELTAAGRALLQHADVLLARAAEAEVHVGCVGGQPPTRIRVAAFATASATIVADAIAALRGRVGVQLIEGDPGDALAALRMRQVDVAVVFDDERHPLEFGDGVIAEHLVDDPMLLALPEGHPAARYERVALTELRGAERIQGAVRGRRLR